MEGMVNKIAGAATPAKKGKGRRKVVKRSAALLGEVIGATGLKKQRSKMPEEYSKTRISKVLKEDHPHPQLGITSEAMVTVKTLVAKWFVKLSLEAVRVARANKKPTVTSRDVDTATLLLLPGELAQLAISEGKKAVTKSKIDE